MGEEKTKPPPPPTSGPRSASRRTLPGGIESPVAPAPARPSRPTSRPPPLPASVLAAPPLAIPRLPPPVPIDGFEDTPMPNTLPSSSLDGAALGQIDPPSVPVKVMPTIAVGDADGAALPPPALILEPAPPFDEAPPSSRSSKPPVSVPPMPQIPKPVSSATPAKLAPGIVSTPTIPFPDPSPESGTGIDLEPERRSRLSPLLVALIAALIGGTIALVVLLAMRKGPAAEAAGDPSSVAAAPPATAEATPSTTADPPAAASTPAPSTPAPPATVAAQPSATAAADATAASAATTASSRPTAAHVGGAPPATTRTRRKSDRIED